MSNIHFSAMGCCKAVMGLAACPCKGSDREFIVYEIILGRKEVCSDGSMLTPTGKNMRLEALNRNVFIPRHQITIAQGTNQGFP